MPNPDDGPDPGPEAARSKSPGLAGKNTRRGTATRNNNNSPTGGKTIQSLNSFADISDTSNNNNNAANADTNNNNAPNANNNNNNNAPNANNNNNNNAPNGISPPSPQKYAGHFGTPTSATSTSQPAPALSPRSLEHAAQHPHIHPHLVAGLHENEKQAKLMRRLSETLAKAKSNAETHMVKSRGGQGKRKL
jgi:hypothetical protein